MRTNGVSNWVSSKSIIAASIIVAVAAAGAAQAASPWKSLTHQPPSVTGVDPASLDVCHVLTDGSVVCLETYKNKWHRLRPNINGSYLDGTWDDAGATVKPMPNGQDMATEDTDNNVCNSCTYAPTFFASAVLASGKMVVIGGEYNKGQKRVSDGDPHVETNIGFLYDPVTDDWGTQLTETNFKSGHVGDAPGTVLQNGTFVLGGIHSKDLESFDPATRTFTLLGSTGKADNNGEEGWNLLPNNTFLTVDATNPGIFEIYDPSTNAWTQPGTIDPALFPNMPVNIADTGLGNSAEVGPGILRPDGTLVYFSGNPTGQNAVYDTKASPPTWTHNLLMDFPLDATTMGQLSMADGPAAVLPSGNVLVVASPVSDVACTIPRPTVCGPYNTPGQFFVFDFATNTLNPLTDQPARAKNFQSYQGRLLVLPSGEVLYTVQEGPGAELYTDIGTPQDAWRPVITSAPTHVVPGATATLSGKLLNGLSEGAHYGDDLQVSTNYPLVRITNNTVSPPRVFYARTHDHSRMGVEAVNTTDIITTRFDVPAGVDLGPACLQVVTNGIASACQAVVVAANHAPVAACKNVTTTASLLFCQGTVAPASVDNGSTDADGDALSFALSPPGPFALGNTGVVLTVTDAWGATATCNATVGVIDVTPPTVVAPPNVETALCTAETIPIGVATGSDNCVAGLTFTGKLISKNGVAIVPPVDVSNGQAHVGHGTYVVQWTAFDGANTSAPALQTVTIDDPLFKNVQQLANGDMRYSITFPQVQAYVEAFVRQNGTQNVSGNIVSSKVTNADGTFTYSRVVPAAQYHAGDVISVRFYSYRANMPGVFTPGPTEGLWFPDFIYGTGTDCQDNGCHPTFTQRANGSVTFTETFTVPQSYVEAFVRRGNTQIAAGNIVNNGIRNLDGTFSYSRLVAASSFSPNDLVTYRFYSYITGQPGVFKPGPGQNVWFPGFHYGQPPTNDCP